MKELTIEEKAKRYDEAIDKIDDVVKAGTIEQGIAEWLFPELKESEDEKIRKEILDYFQQFENEELRGVNISDWITWLEKQGEQNPYSGVSFEYNGHTWGMCARDNGVEILFDGELKAFLSSEKSFIYPIHPQPDLAPKNAMEAIKEERGDNANKPEPKFMAGDWIIFNGLTLHVEEVVEGFYRTISKGGITSSYDWSIDNAARLWTIRDVVDGDVLADGNFIGMFKENSYNPSDKSGCIFLYCSFDMNNDKFYTESGGYNPNYFYPATKAQRDILFQKMKEAGYKWVNR